MSVRRSVQIFVTFPAIDSSDPPTRKTGLTFAPGDAKISKDGGAFVSTTNVPTEIGSSGRYKLDLTAAEMNASWLHIYVENSDMQPADVCGGTNGGQGGAVVANGSNTASSFCTDLSESDTDFWKDTYLVFTSGSLKGQTKKITGFNGTTKFITLASPLTAVPSAGSLFTIINT